VLLHLDGSENLLPAHADPVHVGDRTVGFIGTAVHHYELGPIATAVIKRSVETDSPVIVRTSAGDVAAAQEVVVAP
jgi:folate-binding Fe-S cluster repair protein YgfZ